jgi:anti-sigma factor RsiW
MTRQEAKDVLQVYRPNSADALEPRFAEALKRLERDAELARWFEEQQHFDAALARGVRSVSVPSDLKASILMRGSIVRWPSIVRWLAWQDWRVRAALAASIAFLLIAGVGKLARPSKPFADFRQQLVEQAWAGPKHLDFESSDWKEVRTWLAKQNVEASFQLPSALAELHLHGCNLVDVDGHKVPLICLVDGPRHFHLFVISGVHFPELAEEGSPDFEKCHGWKTASWQQDGRTYVLSGMNYQTFVNKFRKAGRWTMSG